MNDVSNNIKDINNNAKKDNKDSKKITITLVLILVLMVSVTSGTYAYLAVSAQVNNQITGTVASGTLAFQLESSTNTTSGTPSLVYPSTSPYNSGPMIPQYGYLASTTQKNIIQLAVTGGKINGTGSNVPCVDDNGNVICRVYTFTIRNNSTATVQINGRIYFQSAPTNLRWALMTSATSVSVTGTTPATNFRSPQTSSQCTASTATTGTNVNNCWFELGGDESDGMLGKQLVANQYGATGVLNDSSKPLPAGAYKKYWIVFWINETGSVQTDSGTWYATIAFTSSNGTGITSTIVGTAA